MHVYDDFGLKSPAIQETFRTKSATSKVARARYLGEVKVRPS